MRPELPRTPRHELPPKERFAKAATTINGILSRSPLITTDIKEIWNKKERVNPFDETEFPGLYGITRYAILEGTAQALSATTGAELKGIVKDVLRTSQSLKIYPGASTIVAALGERYDNMQGQRTRVNADGLWRAVMITGPLLAQIGVIRREDEMPDIFFPDQSDRIKFVGQFSKVALEAFKKHCPSGRIEEFPADALPATSQG